MAPGWDSGSVRPQREVPGSGAADLLAWPILSFPTAARADPVRARAARDPSTLYRVRFEIPLAAQFDIWVDDVAFTQ